MVDLSTAVLVADTSGYQSSDLSPLARNGIRAVVIKVAEGLHSSNSVQRQQALSTLSAGMTLLGKYEFSLAGDDGAAECDVALSQLADLPFLRVVMDAEASNIGGISRPPPPPGQVIDFGRRAFQWNPNVKPLLYGSSSVIAGLYGTYPEIAGLFDCWYAQYRSVTTPMAWPVSAPLSWLAPFGSNILGWQFTPAFPSSIGSIDASVFDPSVLALPPAPVPPSTSVEDDMYVVIGPVNGEINNVALLMAGSVPKRKWTGTTRDVFGQEWPDSFALWRDAVASRHEIPVRYLGVDPDDAELVATMGDFRWQTSSI